MLIRTHKCFQKEQVFLLLILIALDIELHFPRFPANILHSKTFVQPAHHSLSLPVPFGDSLEHFQFLPDVEKQHILKFLKFSQNLENGQKNPAILLQKHYKRK